MILFIDDEKRRMESWVEALRDEGFEVVQVGSVDAALDIAEDRARRPLIEAVIWDMMMPPKSRLGSDETRAGLATGAKLALRLRELLPRTPLILLTSLGPEVTAPHHRPEELRWGYSKAEIGIYAFATEVVEIVRQCADA